MNSEQSLQRRFKSFPEDRAYLETLAREIRLPANETAKLASVMGAQELKALLSRVDYDYFLGAEETTPFKINLHIHTKASDGIMTARELLDNALEYCLSNQLEQVVVAVTDHDALDSARDILHILAEESEKYRPVRVVLGCELSAAYFDEDLRLPVDFELLYYGLNPFDGELKLLLEKIREDRRRSLAPVMQQLAVKYPEIAFVSEEVLQNHLNLAKGLGCNFPYEVYNYACQKVNDPAQNDFLKDYIFGMDKLDNANYAIRFQQPVSEIFRTVKSCGCGFLSLAHPPRILLDRRLSESFIRTGLGDPGRQFIRKLLEYLSNEGLEAIELYYGNFKGGLKTAFEEVVFDRPPTVDAYGWVKNFVDFARSRGLLFTGGNDTHNTILWPSLRRSLQDEWQKSQLLIAEGYRVLDKEMTMGLPGPCMPPVSREEDSGIGSPYGRGAKRVHKFFRGVIDKILLGPGGKTNAAAHHSPYVSEVLNNPFFIPLEMMVEDGLLSEETLKKIYRRPKDPHRIDFAQVEKDYGAALAEVCHKRQGLVPEDEFIEMLASHYIRQCAYNYIGDIQVKIPDSIVNLHPDAFLDGFTLGSPPDMFGKEARDWNFKVLDPAKIFNADGSLGEAGQILYNIFYNAIASNRGGMRIDHYIGMVNPYVISHLDGQESGRLYSSPKHPLLKKYVKHSIAEFANITRDIILRTAAERGVQAEKIYVEDIGSRPEQMEPVMEMCGLGHLLVSQFVNLDDDNHIYRLKNAKSNDVATLDTHDTASIQEFFRDMDDALRYRHARQLAEDLRFDYNDALKDTRQLIRMKWGELLACPAHRVQAFFTSFTGQEGRYNQPGNPDKWVLRCDPDFEKLYFSNLVNGTAYNPFDAICLAIYARGDAFFEQHRDLVDRLRAQEEKILELAAKVQ